LSLGPPPGSPKPPPTPPIVVVPTPPGPPPPILQGTTGYWMLSRDGRVYPFGDAVHVGDAVEALAPRRALGAEAADLEPTPSGDGYWIVDSFGQVTPFGDAVHFGGTEPSA